ncbi:MAG: T9SS type A sorting domain-containing protein, partial [Bacteroidales bacterium]|nr:T9SS type A sorting domain-containing protein [Bacteroidales bacterium]
AQNGIQIGFGAGGEVDYATVTGIDYVDIVPPIPNWCATAVLLYAGGTVDLNYVTVTNSQTNVYFIDTDGSFTNGSVTTPVANYWADGIAIYASSGKGSKGTMKINPSPLEEIYENSGSKGTVTVDVENSTFTGILHADCLGISGYADGTINLTITGNNINNWDYGIYAYEYAGGLINITAHTNNISGNNFGFYYYSETKGVMDATYNWWGDATGPYNLLNNPAGLGDTVSDNVLFDPWYTNPLMGEQIDIGLYSTTCGDFEVRLRPMQDITNNYLTNVQFAVKWPESTVNLTNISSPVYGLTLQYVFTEGGYNYAVFVTATGTPISWTAGTEYLVMTFSHDESGTGYADFEIGNDAWTQANNAVYYAELLGLDATGLIYQDAPGVYLGTCDQEMKVYLQGPYDPVLEAMETDLNAGVDLPLSQPYNVAPWNYTGAESVTVFDPTVVDWVLVELRTGPNETDMIERKAALLLEDGSVAQYDNIGQGVRFDLVVPGISYYFVVWHRSHFPVMTGTAMEWPWTFGAPGDPYDFTEVLVTQPYGHPDAEVIVDTVLPGGEYVYGMIAGDVTANGELKYSGPGNDRGPIIALIVAVTGSNNLNGVINGGYYSEDVNLNDQVRYVGSDNDRDMIIANITTMTGFPYLHYVFQSVVPGAYTGAKDEAGDNGPLHVFLRETSQNIELVLVTKEIIEEGLIDNVQFTVVFKEGDIEIAKMVENSLSQFGIYPQGPALSYTGKQYRTFVGVTPFFLPQKFYTEDEMVLATLPKYNEFVVGNRLEIATDEIITSFNGMYYVSVWGKDFTGTVKDTYLGSFEAGTNPGINIYPNPVTNGILTLAYQKSSLTKTNIEVIDMHGRVILTKQIDASTASYNVDVSAFEKGVYFLKIHSDQDVDVMRFVVN